MYIMDTLADSSYTRRVVIIVYSIHYYLVSITTEQTVVNCKPQTAASILVDLDTRKLISWILWKMEPLTVKIPGSNTNGEIILDENG